MKNFIKKYGYLIWNIFILGAVGSGVFVFGKPLFCEYYHIVVGPFTDEIGVGMALVLFFLCLIMTIAYLSVVVSDIFAYLKEFRKSSASADENK